MREIIQSIALASSQKRNVRLGNEALYPTLSARVFSGLFGPIFFHRFTASSLSPYGPARSPRFRLLQVSIMAVLPI